MAYYFNRNDDIKQEEEYEEEVENENEDEVEMIWLVNFLPSLSFFFKPKISGIFLNLN